MTAFERLSTGVQRRLFDMRWDHLRPIQDAAIDHVLDGRGDCIISAPTAGGKTEAAFLPILSLLADDHAGSVRAMYVSPLKALINDQFGRIDRLCERMEMPVHRWHGDVGDSARKRLLESPGGILLITPESLEAMFVLRPSRMPALFGRLAFIVVDELHAFIGSPRGAQLQSQMSRLAARCGCDPVRIGLSATLGEPAKAQQWLRPGGPPAAWITDPDAERSVSILVKGYVRPPSRRGDEPDNREAPDIDPILPVIARAILRACHQETNLVFANAKSQIEALADAMVEQAAAMGIRHDVLVHHGSLSKEHRQDAEARLQEERACTAVCSNTLEMGIDIGEVDNVIQVSAPWSVASLAQRLGRSGRRGGKPAVLRAFFAEDAIKEGAKLRELLHLGLLRGVAMIELLREKFCEPPVTDRAHLSTLVHQTLCLLAETGGLSAAALFKRTSACGAFARLSATDFTVLLRSLGAARLVEQMSDGTLLLGELGEQLRDHFSFYAAFAAPEEFRVVHGSHPIGTLPVTSLPGLGEFVILAGRRWCVDAIDVESKELRVSPGRGRRPPRFQSSSADLHPRVHERMLALLRDGDPIPYLDEGANQLLAAARAQASRLPSRVPALERCSERSTRMHLWRGSRVQRTFMLIFGSADLLVEDQEVAIEIEASSEKVKLVLGDFAAAPDGRRLALHADQVMAARVAGDKFDQYLPVALWASAYVRERLNLEDTTSIIAEVLRPAQGRPG